MSEPDFEASASRLAGSGLSGSEASASVACGRSVIQTDSEICQWLLDLHHELVLDFAKQMANECPKKAAKIRADMEC